MAIKASIAIVLLAALTVIGLLLVTQPGNANTDWVPANNGYPGWSNKVQPW